MFFSLAGTWSGGIDDGREYQMQLPGTLDENGIGHEDVGAKQWHPDVTCGNENKAFHPGVIATRFTRKHTYEGEARFTRQVTPELWAELAEEVNAGKRIFLEAERARVLSLLVDGREVSDFVESSISTGHCFEITGLLKEGSELTLLSDNSYPGLPREAIVYSSAATDETQTNWNGVLGRLGIRTELPVFADEIRVYPKGDKLTVKLRIYSSIPFEGMITLDSKALQERAEKQVSTKDSVTEISFDNLSLKKEVLRWDLEEGNLQELTLSLTGGETKTVRFGVRDFGDNGQGRLALNGRTIFIRSEANCGEFPETGYPPMTVEEWKDILTRYRAYGINCMRFHSHCPPEAAFTAADELGMLMQPELSHWNPKDAFESEESWCYYRAELVQLLKMLANHPSFVMLTFGNELCTGEVGHQRMEELLSLAKETDSTRLYANASNGHYGEQGCDANSDFYTSSSFYKWELRGTFANMLGYINHSYPNTETNFETSMAELRKEFVKPVFSFEVGQYEILPDFEELKEFKGISDPANLRLIQERVEKQGMARDWKRQVEATGELSRIGYREEVEAVLRTPSLSGISLLGLQDFPGQGTALVGMMNSHLQPKPFEFAKPERFQSFFREQLPLILLPKYTWETEETLRAEIQIVNYGKEEIEGEVNYRLTRQPKDGRGYSFADDRGELLAEGTLRQIVCPRGGLTAAGILEISFDELGIQKPERCNLTVSIGEMTNLVPIWVYPPMSPVCPEGIYETKHFDEKAREILEKGGRVYLSPDSEKESLPESIQAQFTTDFWSVGTFAGQEGGMGQLIDDEHPLFAEFPTEFHTNWQWWPMANQRAVILPGKYEAIITEMDSYAFLRPMAQLLECRCGRGKVMFSSMGLQNLQQYPEARALQAAIYRYMESEAFAPKQKIEAAVFERLVK